MEESDFVIPPWFMSSSGRQVVPLVKAAAVAGEGRCLCEKVSQCVCRWCKHKPWGEKNATQLGVGIQQHPSTKMMPWWLCCMAQRRSSVSQDSDPSRVRSARTLLLLGAVAGLVWKILQGKILTEVFGCSFWNWDALLAVGCQASWAPAALALWPQWQVVSQVPMKLSWMSWNSGDSKSSSFCLGVPSSRSSLNSRPRWWKCEAATCLLKQW